MSEANTMTNDAPANAGAGNTAGEGAGAPAAGAASPGAAPAAGTGATNPADGQATGAANGSPPGPYRPEGLPETMYGKDDRETLDKVTKAWQGLRQQASKFEPPPKDPTAYDFKWSEKVQPFMTDVSDDKFFQGLRDVAHKAGLNNQQATAFIDGSVGLMLELGLVDQPKSVEAELQKLLPADAATLAKPDQMAAIQRRVSANVAFVDGLAKQHADKLPAEAVEAIKLELAAFPELNLLVEAMRAPGVQPALNGNIAPGITEAELDKRVADKRGRLGSPDYDPAFAAETTRLFKQFYGEAPRQG